MPLGDYRRKRSFDRTPEPSGASTGGAEPTDRATFVVQRHRARRLHYDFRLEIDGVLVSWAVPKGITLDPEERHLAVHVEDHPLEYADFEGVIPEGEYGGGDVIVWDRGTWELHGSGPPARAVRDGELHVDLFGEKLRGRVVLVRTGTRSGREQWLALHKHDAQAVAGWDPEDHPGSVLSGRTNEEVAADPDRLWTRDGAQAVSRTTPEFSGADPAELEALDALPAKGRWNLQGVDLALTNLDKVLFPARDESGPVTKRDLIRYHASIAPALLPHLVDRPLNLHRYPDGSTKPGFWQKQAPKYAPEWIRRWHNDDADAWESEEYLVADSAPALAWLANHGAIELHPWTSRIDDVHKPRYALVDIDPGTDTSWDELLTLARLHRSALDHLGVRGCPKVSGRRGLQVWIPIEPGPTYDDTRSWVERLSRIIAAVAGDLVSWEWEKRARGGRARLDYTQNAINKTLVAPYSARPADGAPVSTPIRWEELDDPSLRPDRWTIRTVGARVDELGDLMARRPATRNDCPPSTIRRDPGGPPALREPMRPPRSRRELPTCPRRSNARPRRRTSRRPPPPPSANARSRTCRRRPGPRSVSGAPPWRPANARAVPPRRPAGSYTRKPSARTSPDVRRWVARSSPERWVVRRNRRRLRPDRVEGSGGADRRATGEPHELRADASQCSSSQPIAASHVASITSSGAPGRQRSRVSVRSGPASPNQTVPAGWPSCSSGPATPVTASARSAPSSRRAFAAIAAARAPRRPVRPGRRGVGVSPRTRRRRFRRGTMRRSPGCRRSSPRAHHR